MTEKCVTQMARNSRHFSLTENSTVQSSDFITSFILENFRLSPLVDYTDRICQTNFSYQTSSFELFKFEKGDVIHFPIKELLEGRISLQSSKESA